MADKERFDALFERVYQELKQIARHQHRRHPNAALDTTELVNGLYEKLQDRLHLAERNTQHFKSTLAHAIRYLVLDEVKRPDFLRYAVSLTQDGRVVELQPEMQLDLRQALQELGEQRGERAVQVAELWIFGRYRTADIAQELGVSWKVAAREVKKVLLWLKDRLDSWNAPPSASTTEP